MTPSEVKRYLSERKIAPLNDIAVHFDMEPDAVRGVVIIDRDDVAIVVDLPSDLDSVPANREVACEVVV